MNWDTDIVVAGGGLAGLAAAVAFGSEGWRVCLAAPAPLREDRRTTAIFQPGQALLEQLGVWSLLGETPMPLQQMRIVDASGGGFVERTFDAGDVSELPFGWNLRNEALRLALESRLAVLPVERLAAPVESMVARSQGVLLHLGGRAVRAGMVLGCDGRESFVRKAAGIGLREARGGQKALVFQVRHPVPHENVSIEVHDAGGPFTLVPLPLEQGQHVSAVVWMAEGAELARLVELTEATFEAEATERSRKVLGALELVSKRQVWPLRIALAERLAEGRVALAGEAAHVVPPIGAQGFNMTLDDIAALRAACQGKVPGVPEALAAYHRRRWPQLALRVGGVGLLGSMSRAGEPVAQGLRRQGLAVFHDLPPLRKMLMRMGMGA